MSDSAAALAAAHPVVLVDFFAVWCEPCKWVGPVLDDVSKHFRGGLPIGKVDIDQYPAEARDLHIMSVPTLVLFRDGKEVWRMRGFDTAPQLIRILEELIK